MCLLPTRLAVVPGHRASGWAGPPPVLTQAERAFAVPPEDAALLRRGGGAYALHFFCVRLDDDVRGRLHWPCHASLSVSGVALVVPCRTASHDLGPGGRDPPAVAPPGLLAAVLSGATLRLTVAGYDARPFAVLAFVARARPMAEIEAELPPAAPFAEALRAACTAVRGDDAAAGGGGGGGAGGASSDDDDVAEMRVDALPLSLRDPISGARVADPVRFAGCTGLAVFDLRTFLTVTQRSRRWQCPRCAACGGPGALRRDAFVAALLAASAALEDVDDVEVNREGHWRPRLPCGAFGRWVSPEETEAAAKPGAPRQQLGLPDAPAGVKPERDDDAPPAAAAPAYARADVAIDVIDLCGDTSDEDDGDGAPSKRARFTPQPPPPATQPQAAPPPPGGLRVRLSVPAEAHLMPRMQPSSSGAPSMPSLFPVVPTAARPGATSSATVGGASAGGGASVSVSGGVPASSAALRRPSFPFAGGAAAPSAQAPSAREAELASLAELSREWHAPSRAGAAATLSALAASIRDAELRAMPSAWREQGQQSTAPDADGWRHRRPAAPPPPPETIEIDD